jgi:predicted nucleic acid-binding Zn ribbon protein
MSEYLHSQGHEEAYVLGAVCAHWADVVGADVAAHVTPASVRDGELRVSVDHAGWVTQLAFLSDQILARLGEQLGQHLVGRLKVTVRARPGVE